MLCPQSSQEKKLKEKEKINFFSKMRECDIVVGTLLFFLAKKKYLAINGQKTQHLKREKKKEPEKKIDFTNWRISQKSQHTKKNEFVSQICVSLCLQFLDR